MTMKNLTAAFLAAALLLSAASCSNEPAPAETTTSAETTTTTAETTTTPEATTAPETTTPAPKTTAEATEETDAFDTIEAPQKLEDSLPILRENVPIYANYVEEQRNFPIHIRLVGETDSNETRLGSVGAVEKVNLAPDRAALLTSAAEFQARIVLDRTCAYFLNDAYQSYTFYEMDESEIALLCDTLDQASPELILPSMHDASELTFETGTEEYKGKEYLFEKISAPDADMTVYADPATKQIRYFMISGFEWELTVFSHDADESLFEIPSDYTQLDYAGHTVMTHEIDGSKPEATTTPETTTAPETTTPAPKTTAEATEETESSAKNKDPMTILRENVPIYANFVEEQVKLPIHVAFKLPFSETSEKTVLAPDRFAVLNASAASRRRVILDGNRIYLIDDTRRTCTTVELDTYDASRREDLIDLMTLNRDMMPFMFNASGSVFETGTEEYKGKEYLYEKFYTSEGENAFVVVYADPATEQVQYLVADGREVEVTAFTHDADESLFEIPNDYERTTITGESEQE